MQQTIKRLFLLFFVISSANLVLGQKRINKKDQKEINRVCEVYLRQHDSILINFDAPTDSILQVISPQLSTIILTRREYFRKMEFENLHFSESEVTRLELNDSVGCIINIDPDGEFKLNVNKVVDSWIIVGFDNHVTNQEDIDSHAEYIEEALELEIVKDSIKEILKEFVKGWSELRQTKKSDLLKSNTTSEFYDFLLKTVEYEELKDYGNRKVTLKDLERVDIIQDTAWCRVGIIGKGGTLVGLLLQNDVWLVAGADHRICTQQDVIDVEDKITSYHELEKFNVRIGAFNEHIEAFFKTGDRSLLKENASNNLINQLEIYRRLAGTMDTNYLGVRGLGEASWLESSFVIYGDIAYYKTFSDSIRWIKKDDKWLLDEMFMSIDQDNKCYKAQQTFDTFMDMFFVTYSFTNTQGYRNIPMVVTSYSDTDYSRVQNYTRPSRRSPHIVYEAGNDKLFEDLENLTQQVSNKTSFKGIIYVEFDVDNVGKAQNIHALDQIGTNEAGLAEKIVGQLGNWLPNDNEQSSITNMVVAIQF